MTFRKEKFIGGWSDAAIYKTLNTGSQDLVAVSRRAFRVHQMMLCKLCLPIFSDWLNKGSQQLIPGGMEIGGALATRGCRLGP